MRAIGNGGSGDGVVSPVAVFAEEQKAKDDVYEELNLFDEAFERIRQDSVDPVTDPKLVGAAIAGMLSGLDPHSPYLDPAPTRRCRPRPATIRPVSGWS